MAIERSKKFLRNHDSERLSMFVMYVDLVGSTTMSSNIDPQIFNIIIRSFSQEMSYVIEQFDGYVLKFVGDAVLGYFIVDKNSKKTANNVVDCANAITQVIDKAINPIFKIKGIPNLKVKISSDFGKCSVVRYGSDKRRSHIDLIGLTLNLAAKMQSMAKPNQILIGEYVFTKLSPSLKKLFKKTKTNPNEWKYHELDHTNPYSVYRSIC
ncbi:MAG: adenylate/guanylate cyclase domain-containing protein [Nitrosopumilaceae archaeon]